MCPPANVRTLYNSAMKGSAEGATLRHHRHRRLSAALTVTAFALLVFATLHFGAVVGVGVGGPGSVPPNCRSKCGKCSPCKAVHGPIQPGRSFPLEYYPEAWRCKCGTKLFMP